MAKATINTNNLQEIMEGINLMWRNQLEGLKGAQGNDDLRRQIENFKRYTILIRINIPSTRDKLEQLQSQLSKLKELSENASNEEEYASSTQIPTRTQRGSAPSTPQNTRPQLFSESDELQLSRLLPRPPSNPSAQEDDDLSSDYDLKSESDASESDYQAISALAQRQRKQLRDQYKQYNEIPMPAPVRTNPTPTKPVQKASNTSVPQVTYSPAKNTSNQRASTAPQVLRGNSPAAAQPRTPPQLPVTIPLEEALNEEVPVEKLQQLQQLYELLQQREMLKQAIGRLETMKNPSTDVESNNDAMDDNEEAMDNEQEYMNERDAELMAEEEQLQQEQQNIISERKKLETFIGSLETQLADLNAVKSRVDMLYQHLADAEQQLANAARPEIKSSSIAQQLVQQRQLEEEEDDDSDASFESFSDSEYRAWKEGRLNLQNELEQKQLEALKQRMRADSVDSQPDFLPIKGQLPSTRSVPIRKDLMQERPRRDSDARRDLILAQMMKAKRIAQLQDEDRASEISDNYSDLGTDDRDEEEYESEDELDDQAFLEYIDEQAMNTDIELSDLKLAVQYSSTLPTTQLRKEFWKRFFLHFKSNANSEDTISMVPTQPRKRSFATEKMSRDRVSSISSNGSVAQLIEKYSRKPKSNRNDTSVNIPDNALKAILGNDEEDYDEYDQEDLEPAAFQSSASEDTDLILSLSDEFITLANAFLTTPSDFRFMIELLKEMPFIKDNNLQGWLLNLLHSLRDSQEPPAINPKSPSHQDESVLDDIDINELHELQKMDQIHIHSLQDQQEKLHQNEIKQIEQIRRQGSERINYEEEHFTSPIKRTKSTSPVSTLLQSQQPLKQENAKSVPVARFVSQRDRGNSVQSEASNVTEGERDEDEYGYDELDLLGLDVDVDDVVLDEESPLAQFAKQYTDEIINNEIILKEIDLKILELLESEEAKLAQTKEKAKHSPRFSNENIDVLINYAIPAIRSRTGNMDVDLQFKLESVFKTFVGVRIHAEKDGLISEISSLLYDEMIFNKVIQKIDNSYRSDIEERLKQQRNDDISQLKNERRQRLIVSTESSPRDSMEMPTHDEQPSQMMNYLMPEKRWDNASVISVESSTAATKGSLSDNEMNDHGAHHEYEDEEEFEVTKFMRDQDDDEFTIEEHYQVETSPSQKSPKYLAVNITKAVSPVNVPASPGKATTPKSPMRTPSESHAVKLSAYLQELEESSRPSSARALQDEITVNDLPSNEEIAKHERFLETNEALILKHLSAMEAMNRLPNDVSPPPNSEETNFSDNPEYQEAFAQQMNKLQASDESTESNDAQTENSN